MTLLSAELQSIAFDVFLAVETWFDSTVTDSLILSDSSHVFSIFRRDRTFSPGGGVAIIVKTSLLPTPVPIPVLSKASHAAVELVCVDTSSPPLRLIVWYRPPSGSAAQQADILAKSLEVLAPLTEVSLPVILFSDANFPGIDWGLGSSSNRAERLFLDFLLQSSLTQLIRYPTRGANILDLLLTNVPSGVSDLRVSASRLLSDHSEISWSLLSPSSTPPPATAFTSPTSSPSRNYSYRRADVLAIRHCLDGFDWDWISAHASSPSEHLSMIESCLFQAFDEFIPLRCNRPSSIDPFPPFLALLRRRRLSALRSAWISPRKRAAYLRLDRIYRARLSRLRDNQERATLKKGLKGLFLLFRKRVKPKSTSASSRILVNGVPARSEVEEAAAFAEVFASSYQVDNGMSPIMPAPVISSTLSSVHLHPGRVRKALERLRPKFSSGIDGIPPVILKHLAPSLSIPLSQLFMHILMTNSPPPSFLVSTVTPVFKRKGSPSDPHNYRPVGVNTSFSKLFESLLNDALLAHLYDNDLIPASQFGFLPKRSTTSQLLCCLSHWTSAIAKGNRCFTLYTDFSGAFNAPTHPKLRHKLHQIGVRDPLLSLLYSLLSTRSAYVKRGSANSESYFLSSGSVQGSSLSCTLFLIATADLLHALAGLGVAVFAYADDLKIIAEDPVCMTNAIDLLSNWCSTWQLPLAPAKCSMLYIGFPDSSNLPTFLLDGVALPPVPATGVRDLGLCIQPSLSFSGHVSLTTSKARSLIAIIFRSLRSRRHSVLLNAYKIYVLPVLDYASPAYGALRKADAKILEQCQSFFTRRLVGRCNLPRHTAPERLRTFDLDSLAFRRLIADLSFMQAVQRGFIYCPAISPLIQSHRYPTSRPLSITREVSVPFPRAAFLTNRIAPFWNSIPSDKIALSRASFSEFLRKHFHEHRFDASFYPSSN